MTVTVSIRVPKHHRQEIRAQKRRWHPQSDDGSTNLPARWENDGEEFVVEPQADGEGAREFVLCDEHQSITFWEVDREEAPAAEATEA